MMPAHRQTAARGDRRGRGRRGLTLLEVLGAFLIFSLVFTALIGMSQTGVYQQGRAARALEAGLIADEVMADIEWQLSQRLRPIVDPETPREIYEVVVQESPLTEGMQPPPSAGGDELDLTAMAGGLDGLSMLAMQAPEIAGLLRRYEVEVSWVEDGGPTRIVRTTFGLDWEAPEVQSLFEAAGVSGGLGGGEGAAGATGDAAGSDREAGRRGEDGRRAREDGGSQGPPSAGGGSGELTIDQMRQMLGI